MELVDRSEPLVLLDEPIDLRVLMIQCDREPEGLGPDRLVLQAREQDGLGATTVGTLAQIRVDAMTDRLRVLVTDGPGVRLDQVTRTVAGLGHDVIARESSLPDVARITATERPDVAVVIVHEGNTKGLEMIDRIVHEAACPVIAVLDVQDRAFIQEAAKRGIFAYIADGHDPQEMQSSIDIVLRRFAEYHDLEGAFSRRAVTERAKGILMERHGIDEQAAFAMLRDESRRTNRKLIDLAEAVVTSRAMLSARRSQAEGLPAGEAEPI